MNYTSNQSKMLRFFVLLITLTLGPISLTQAMQTTKSETFKPTKKQHKKQSLSERLEKAARPGRATWMLFLIAFLTGILMSFTPCVYPMIPITISIMHGNAATSLLRNFMTAVTYVAGMSIVYASLGYVAATSSVIFGQWVASPWVVGITVLFFLYFAFSLFGFYELYVPRFLQQHGEIKTRGSLARIFLFGMITGTVASPCLTPGLAALLTLAAKVGNPLVGFLILFFFSIGMGCILIIIGTFSGALALLPRAGEWLDESKRIMGFLLLGMCVYFAQHFMSNIVTWTLYGLVAAAAVAYVAWRLFVKQRKQQ